MKIFSKTAVPTLILIIVFGALYGCGTPKPREIRVGLLRIDDSLPFYAAEEKGLFEKHGVNVTLHPFTSSADQSRAMEAGELDIVMNDMIVQCLMKKSGVNTKVIAHALGANESEGRFLIVSSPQYALKSPAELEGLTLAISSNTMMDYLTEQFAGLGLFELDRVNTVNMPNLMLRVEALIEGRDIQAAILPDPLASYALYAGCHMVIDDTGLGINLSQSVVLASDRLISEESDKLRGVLAAYWEAMELINSTPDEYRDFCLEKANVPPELSETYPTPSYTPRSLPDAEDVRRVTAWMLGRGLIAEAYSYEELVDSSYADDG